MQCKTFFLGRYGIELSYVRISTKGRFRGCLNDSHEGSPAGRVYRDGKSIGPYSCYHRFGEGV